MIKTNVIRVYKCAVSGLKFDEFRVEYFELVRTRESEVFIELSTTFDGAVGTERATSQAAQKRDYDHHPVAVAELKRDDARVQRPFASAHTRKPMIQVLLPDFKNASAWQSTSKQARKIDLICSCSAGKSAQFVC